MSEADISSAEAVRPVDTEIAPDIVGVASPSLAVGEGNDSAGMAGLWTCTGTERELTRSADSSLSASLRDSDSDC